MKSFTVTYNKTSMEKLPVDKINAAQSILVQIFSANFDKEAIERVVCAIENRFPRAQIIGATTFGNIQNGNLEDDNITLTITPFFDATIDLLHLKSTTVSQSFDSGVYLAERLIKQDTKALILFSEQNSLDATSMLDGIHTISGKKKIVIGGGVAGFVSDTNRAYLISNHGISEKGIVAVALSGESLQVQQHYKSDWLPFGKKLLITHATGRRVYTIDHMPAAELFSHYLGEAFVENFDETRELFPLIKVGSGAKIARTPLKKYPDGSIEFAGKISNGELYRIGFGNLEEMILNKNLPLEKIRKQAPSSLFVYSCVARRRYMQNKIIEEIAPLCGCSPVSGFFTCGEFYSGKKRAVLLNQSMTIISIQEKVPSEKPIACRLPEKKKKVFSTLEALSHLMMVTESETKEYHSYLEARESLLCQGPVVHFKATFDEPAGFLYVSQNVRKLLGYSTKEFINNEVTMDMLMEGETRERIRQELVAHREHNAHFYETKIKVYAKYGDTKYLHIFIDMVQNDHTNRSDFIGYAIDITEQVLSEEKIKKLAFYDHITGLPNREMLKRTLQTRIAGAKAHGDFCAVTFFDLDKFKDVNDTYGHSVGDKLLQMIANRVRAVLKEDDFIARIGGDEFILIHSKLKRNSVQQHILATVNRIITIIGEPFNIEGKIAHVSTSIGTAIYGIDGESVEDLIRHADMAMYEAKNDPNIHFKFYSHTMKLLRQEEMELKNALKAAVKNREFTLVYQPQVDIETGRIVGAEALMRWNHPERGEVSPVVFIPLVEEMNLIIELGEWLLEEVCHKIQHLQNHADLTDSFRTISVNISSLQFADPYFITKVQSIIDLLQIDTRYLEFELTESILAENIAEMIEKMKKLKEMGITLSLDDFGTGYSSLQYLKDLPIDTIKIDRSFIKDVHEDNTDQMLTSTIIQLSQNMQCKIVAEGVENLEQLVFLEKNNCQTYQGFYFSKPITFTELEKLIFEKTTAEA